MFDIFIKTYFLTKLGTLYILFSHKILFRVPIPISNIFNNWFLDISWSIYNFFNDGISTSILLGLGRPLSVLEIFERVSKEITFKFIERILSISTQLNPEISL